MGATDAQVSPLNWDYDDIAGRRRRYLSPALATFEAYENPIALRSGAGQYLYDAVGAKYLDCLAQNLCISVGYAHPVVTREVKRQIDDLQHCTTMYYHPAPAALAESLVETLPADVDWVMHFVCSGSEAIDLAMLMARVFTGSADIVCLRKSYHGLHFGAMTATGLASCHQPAPAAPGILHVDNPDQYRGIHGPGIDSYVAALQATIESSTPGRIAGFLFEPIQGFGGVMPLPDGYPARAAEIVRAAGGLLICDEIQTGFGRTGAAFWGFAAHAVTPDIVVMAKGIANGFPLAAVAVRRDVADAMARRKFFNTYGSNPVSCAAGRAVLAVIAAEGLQENARVVGCSVRSVLDGLQQRHECIGDVRGQGLMLGVEIVVDRHSRTPDPIRAASVHEAARRHGVIMGRGGANGNVLRINPPLCVTHEDARLVGEALGAAFEENPDRPPN